MIAKTKTKTQKRLTTAAEYVRMSSGKQERSPAQQRAEIKKLAAREGCKIARRFVDEGITGDSGPEQRPDFKAMLEAAEQGEFDVLLLENIDRLGRFDSLVGAEYYNRLRRAGVKIITCADGPIDLDSFEGRLVQTVKQEGKHAFLKDLSRKVLRGQVANAKAGNWNGGSPPYAMDRALCDKTGKVLRRLSPGESVRSPGCCVRLTPSQDKVKIRAVRFAFERFATSDIGYRALARELSQREFPAPGTGGWTHNDVRRILKCSAYVGAATWGLTTAAQYHTCQAGEIAPVAAKGKYEEKPAEEAVVVENAHGGIVDSKIFDRAQRKIARRSRRNTARDEYPLAGLIYCANCGRPMHGSTIRRKNRQGKVVYTYSRYVCATYNKYQRDERYNKTCGHFAIPSDLVLSWLTRVLQAIFLGQAREALVERIKAELERTAKGGEADVKRLQGRLRELDREVGRLVKAVRTVDLPELVHELADCRGERDGVKAELSRQARYEAPGDVQSEAEGIADTVWELGEQLSDADPVTLRELFQQLVSKIVCRFERVPKKSRRAECRLVERTVHLRPNPLLECFTGTGISATAILPPGAKHFLAFSGDDLRASRGLSEVAEVG